MTQPHELRAQPPAGYGWTGPVAAASSGVSSVPLLFVSASSFVLALVLGTVGVLLGGLLVVETSRPAHRMVSLVGVVGGLLAGALLVLPFFFQQ